MKAACIRIVCNQAATPEIRINRPVHAARVFCGRSCEDVMRLLPLMFSVCGTAQAIAGSHAMRAAIGEAHTEAVTTAHGALVRFEVAREHLWRIMLDWPRFTGHRLRSRALGAIQSLVPQARDALFESNPFALAPQASCDRRALDAVRDDFNVILEQDLLGLSPARWLAMDEVAELLAYLESHDGAVPRLLNLLVQSGWQAACPSRTESLPRLVAADIDGILADGGADRFVEAPDWAGSARETSALTRQRDNPLVAAVIETFGIGLLARAVAAVVELAATTQDIDMIMEGFTAPGIVSEQTAGHAGVAQVEAARGRLVHRVVRDGDIITDYRVVAPTEWNFHQAGPVAEGLTGLAEGSRDAMQQQADLFLTLMDPCVDWSLELN